MDGVQTPGERLEHERAQVRAIILLAERPSIGAVSITNLADATDLVAELAEEAGRHGVVLVAGSPHAVVARRQ